MLDSITKEASGNSLGEDTEDSIHEYEKEYQKELKSIQREENRINEALKKQLEME